MSVSCLDIEQKRNFGENQGTNVRKMTGNIFNPDLVNIKAYTKFGDILSFCSQDIEGKQNFERNSDITQGP